MRAEKIMFKRLRDEVVFTFSPALRDISMTEMYGRQFLTVDLKTIMRTTSELRNLILQKDNELGFNNFHPKFSKRNSLTDSDNSPNRSQSSPSSSSNVGRK